jgi:UPF0271 protein
VKPHGALYNMAARDRRWRTAIARGVQAVDASLVLFGLSGSQLVAAGERAVCSGVRGVCRPRLQSRWQLAPRGTPGAVLTDVADVVRRCGRHGDRHGVVTSRGRRFA